MTQAERGLDAPPHGRPARTALRHAGMPRLCLDRGRAQLEAGERGVMTPKSSPIGTCAHRGPTGRALSIAMLLDWYFPYAVGVANAIAPLDDRLTVVTRDHGIELGLSDDSSGTKRAMLDERVWLSIVSGRQRDPRSLGDLFRVRRLLARFGPDVLHIQEHADWRLYALQRALPGVPTIVTIHDVVHHEGAKEREGVSLPLRNHIQRSVRTHAGAYIVHGRRLAGLLRDQDWYMGQPVHVIPHGGLPYAAATAPLPRTPTLLFFGRLEYYKGLDLLVEAAHFASARVPGLRIIVAGRGPEGARCKNLVTTPDVFDWRTEFVPHEQTASLFAEASAVVLPYRDASQSGVVPMAFANGRAVIATDVGSLGEIVRNGRNGLIVGQVSPVAIAEAIVRMFTEKGLLEQLSAGAVATMTTGVLAPEHIAQLHLRAYARLALAARGVRRQGAARGEAHGRPSLLLRRHRAGDSRSPRAACDSDGVSAPP